MTEQENPNLYSPLTLAFLGDAVYELCARAYVVAQQNRPVGELHQQVVALVKKQHEKARQILTDNRQKLDELAHYLYEKETITGEEFLSILNA